MAHKALSAAKAQSVSLPAQEVASRIVAELAAEILVDALKERIESIDEELKKRFSLVARLGFSLACRAWDRSSGPSSSWSPWVTSALSRVLIGSPLLCRSCPGGP